MGNIRRRQINLNAPEKRQTHLLTPENAPAKMLVALQQEINRKKEFLHEGRFLFDPKVRKSRMRKKIKDLERQRNKLLEILR